MIGDGELNKEMRSITGTVDSTPRLSAISNIPPSDIRTKKALLLEHLKLMKNSHMPLHDDVLHPPAARLIYPESR